MPGSVDYDNPVDARVKPRTHPFAVILSQDCDLESDFKARNQVGVAADKLLPSVLFCEVYELNELINMNNIAQSNIYKRIVQNKDERYHFLQRVDPAMDSISEGLPNLGIDFKKYFSVPTEEVYAQINGGRSKRRCYLHSPYLEHLSSRYCYYQFRVALPVDHEEPPRVR